MFVIFVRFLLPSVTGMAWLAVLSDAVSSVQAPMGVLILVPCLLINTNTCSHSMTGTATRRRAGGRERLSLFVDHCPSP